MILAILFTPEPKLLEINVEGLAKLTDEVIPLAGTINKTEGSALTKETGAAKLLKLKPNGAVDELRAIDENIPPKDKVAKGGTLKSAEEVPNPSVLKALLKVTLNGIKFGSKEIEESILPELSIKLLEVLNPKLIIDAEEPTKGPDKEAGIEVIGAKEETIELAPKPYAGIKLKELNQLNCDTEAEELVKKLLCNNELVSKLDPAVDTLAREVAGIKEIPEKGSIELETIALDDDDHNNPAATLVLPNPESKGPPDNEGMLELAPSVCDNEAEPNNDKPIDGVIEETTGIPLTEIGFRNDNEALPLPRLEKLL